MDLYQTEEKTGVLASGDFVFFEPKLAASYFVRFCETHNGESRPKSKQVELEIVLDNILKMGSRRVMDIYRVMDAKLVTEMNAKNYEDAEKTRKAVECYNKYFVGKIFAQEFKPNSN